MTLVSPEQQARLDAIAAELHVDIEQQQPPPPLAEAPEDMEGQRQALDDLYNLY